SLLIKTIEFLARWKNWKHIRPVYCIEPFLSFYLTAEMNFYYNSARLISIIPQGFGLILVAATRARVKTAWQPPKEDCGKKWDLAQTLNSFQNFHIKPVLKTGSLSMNSIISISGKLILYRL